MCTLFANSWKAASDQDGCDVALSVAHGCLSRLLIDAGLFFSLALFLFLCLLLVLSFSVSLSRSLSLLINKHFSLRADQFIPLTTSRKF